MGDFFWWSMVRNVGLLVSVVFSMESAMAARAANAAAVGFMVAMEDITRFRPRRSPPSVESNSSGPETYGGTVEGPPARARVEDLGDSVISVAC